MADFESLDRAFEQGARAFRSRLPCRPPAHYSGDLAEAYDDGWHAALDEVQGAQITPQWDPRQLVLFQELRA